jgi:fatty acid desaturase
MKNYLKTLWEDPAAARKAFVALIGAALQVLLVLFPTAPWLPAVVAVATALGVFHVRNKVRKPQQKGMQYR